MTDPLRNPKDPLHKSGPEAERELFRAIGLLANGYPMEVVLGAAANMLVNAVRQGEPTRDGAKERFDELMARVRMLLLDEHYDAMGKRRNVFPFHQQIDVPLVDLRRKH